MRVMIASMMLALGLSTAVAQSQDTTITISFVLRSDVIAPVPQRGRNYGYSATLILSGDNRVREKWQSASVAGVNAYHSDDSGMGSRWRVVSPNTIQATWPMPTYTKTVTVRVQGKSCTVQHMTQLRPGETEYKRKVRGQFWTFSKPAMIDPSCSIR